jgi:hypothetical protein
MSRYLFAAACLTIAAAASAQTVEESKAAKDALDAQKALIDSQKALVDSQKALTDSKIAALGLPSFEDKTELKDGGGKLEAAMLTARVMEEAAKEISYRSGLCPRPATRLASSDQCKVPGAIVLSDTQTADFSALESMRRQITKFSAALTAAKNMVVKKPPPKKLAGDVAIGGAIAAAKAIAGVLRTETTITAIDLTSTLPSRVLANSLAAQINGWVPDAVLKVNNSKLIKDYADLAELAAEARGQREALGAKPAEGAKPKAAALDAALKAYDAFADAVTKADANGVLPLVAAARLETAESSTVGVTNTVIRVRAEYSAGTFVSAKNLWTSVGVDPVKVSGGVIASYVVTDPSTGLVGKSGIVICRTTLTSLRHVQNNDAKAATFKCQ